MLEKPGLLLGKSSSSRAEIIANAFKMTKTDLAISPIDTYYSGSTANVVFLLPDVVLCANVGDSRAILGSCCEMQGDDAQVVWSVKELSTDHKPELKEERERITGANGRVEPYYGRNLNLMFQTRKEKQSVLVGYGRKTSTPPDSR